MAAGRDGMTGSKWSWKAKHCGYTSGRSFTTGFEISAGCQWTIPQIPRSLWGIALSPTPIAEKILKTFYSETRKLETNFLLTTQRRQPRTKKGPKLGQLISARHKIFDARTSSPTRKRRFKSPAEKKEKENIYRIENVNVSWHGCRRFRYCSFGGARNFCKWQAFSMNKKERIERKA